MLTFIPLSSILHMIHLFYIFCQDSPPWQQIYAQIHHSLLWIKWKMAVKGKDSPLIYLSKSFVSLFHHLFE